MRRKLNSQDHSVEITLLEQAYLNLALFLVDGVAEKSSRSLEKVIKLPPKSPDTSIYGPDPEKELLEIEQLIRTARSLLKIKRKK
jgi:hypothetical protein